MLSIAPITFRRPQPAMRFAGLEGNIAKDAKKLSKALTAHKNLRASWQDYPFKTLLEDAWRDPQTAQYWEKIKDRKYGNNNQIPRLLTAALHPQMALLAKRARGGEDIHLSTKPSLSNAGRLFLIDKGLKGFDSTIWKITMFRLQEAFPDVLKMKKGSGPQFTLKKCIDTILPLKMTWELLQQEVRERGSHTAFPSIEAFWKIYRPGEQFDDTDYAEIRDCYNHLIERHLIRLRPKDNDNDNDNTIWQKNQSGRHKPDTPEWCQIGFETTDQAQSLLPSSWVKLVENAEGKVRIRAITQPEILQVQALQIARELQRLANSRIWPINFASLSETMNLESTALHRDR